MWAQLITLRLKEGHEAELPVLAEHLDSMEQPGSGLLRSMTMRDQSDPAKVYFLVVFESEAKARVRESDPRRTEGLQQLRAMMADVVDGPQTFVDLEVVTEFEYS